MLKRFFRAILCSVIFMGKIHAQEVVVAREKKTEPSKQTPEPPKQVVQPSAELPSETPAPTRTKSKSREKKSSSATLTLEEMRAAGARAAGGSTNESVSQSATTDEPEAESVPAPNPTVAAAPRPVKKETPFEQRSSSRPSKSGGTHIEGMGPIRPTLMESGREAPSPSPQ
jgi:hypothetical protein